MHVTLDLPECSVSGLNLCYASASVCLSVSFYYYYRMRKIFGGVKYWRKHISLLLDDKILANLLLQAI